MAGESPGWAAADAMVVGDALGGIPRAYQLLVLGLMVGSALWSLVRASGPAHLAFVACALMWSRANQAFEVAVRLIRRPPRVRRGTLRHLKIRPRGRL